jgi:casein kinase II subunit alpha
MVNHEQCIIKVLKPVAAKKIKREIKVLRNLTGGPNVIALLDVVLDRKTYYSKSAFPTSLHLIFLASARYHSLVMEYVENIEWKHLFPRLTEADIKHYTFQLLKVCLFAAFSCSGYTHTPSNIRRWTLLTRMASCIET